MNNKVDLLLKLDKTKLVRPTREIEIKRLSENLGEPFVITCQALTSDEYEELQESVSLSADGKINTDKNIQVETVIRGVKDPNLNNQKIVEYFGGISASDAVGKIFLPGEVSSIYTVVTELSGFNKDAVKEIKNLSTQMGKSGSCTNSGKKKE
ncbi:hypothetical protein [Clostridium sp. AWRP]|uniref:phage tail assembly chaperone n=1 Tax=Clostridium sp. AWRP TaxID=2212991 RepID=UPI000FD7D52B|nr:hypothetical protein [Clostridium sp. AWRP]AZV57924.1 hypothetical protein DMR38_15655 [Clostridium sp. AWRP]